MKPLHLCLLLCAFCLSASAQTTSTEAVKKVTATDIITEDLKIGTGRTLTLNSGGTLTLSGSVGGTPTGGTLDIHSLTLTLPASVTGGGSSFARLDSANAFTALQTITQASANSGILASTGYSLTGSDATTMLSLTGTLNTSGNPTLVKVAISNTASGATTKFLDFLAGASGTTSQFSVAKDGTVTNAGSIVSTATTAATTTVGAIQTDGGVEADKDSFFNTVRVGLGLASTASNTVLGVSAGAAITSAANSLFAGNSAGIAITSGTRNTYLGAAIAPSQTTGNDNTAVGYATLAAMSSSGGAENVAVGSQALTGLTSGTDNTGLGFGAGSGVTSGQHNVIIGDSAGASLTTGTSCIMIGNGSTASAGNVAGEIVVGSATGKGAATASWGNSTTTGNYLYGSPSGGGFISQRLSGNYTTTSASNTDTALSFTAAANEVWTIDVQLTVVAPAAGTKLQITAPTSATVEGHVISVTGSAVSDTRITAINTLTAAIATNTTNGVTVRVTVVNSSNAGTIAIGAASTTGGQTTTISSGSWLRAVRAP